MGRILPQLRGHAEWESADAERRVAEWRCYPRSMMQMLALAMMAFAIALAVAAVRNRRNIRSCCARDASCDLRMRDA